MKLDESGAEENKGKNNNVYCRHDATEKDLWIHFKQVGDVREIFISRKRNRNGKRYGFVRFKGLRDVHQVEKKLDSMIFGGLKMYVNTPKFGRAKWDKSPPTARGRADSKQRKEVNRDTYLRMQPKENIGAQQGSYAEVVRRHIPVTGQKRTPDKEKYIGYSSRSSVILDTPLRGQQWLQEAWVGRLKNLAMFDRIEDEMLWDIGENISPKYIGDDLVLILGLTEEKALRVMEEGDTGWGDLFTSLEKWNPKLRPGYRLTWVHCWGIPLMAWDIPHIKQIVSSIGDMVEADDDVEDLRKLDRARILVKTPWKPLIQHDVNVQIEGETFVVHIVEESGVSCARCQCRRQNEFSSSEEIYSDESELGTPLETSSKTWRKMMRTQGIAANFGAASGGSTKSGEGEEGEPRSAGANKPPNDDMQRSSETPTAVCTATKGGADSQKRWNDGMQEVAENPIGGFAQGKIGEDSKRTTAAMHGSPEKMAEGTSTGRVRAVSQNGTNGYSDGLDPKDKDEVQLHAQSDTVQTTSIALQMHGRLEEETNQTSLHLDGGSWYKEVCVNSDDLEQFHENGNKEAQVNVEHLGRFKTAADRSRDKEVEGLTDLGYDIYTPSKLGYPHQLSPISHITGQNKSWLVYSRKRGGKKPDAHEQRAVINPAETHPHPKQQEKNKKEAEVQRG
uniref:RRM domain-containing protein n=1 Tax=Glycine max TaxID=3847 RepID=A0A0R0JWP7_SOYBN